MKRIPVIEENFVRKIPYIGEPGPLFCGWEDFLLAGRRRRFQAGMNV